MATLERTDPFTSLATSWQQDIDRMFRTLAESFGGVGTLRTRGTDWLPSADVFTRGDDLVIHVEIPGIDPQRDVEISVEDGMLHVAGQRQESEEAKSKDYIRRETYFGRFERSLPLPPGVRTEDIKATYENGILEVVVPGAAKRPTQRVQVEVAGEKKKK